MPIRRLATGLVLVAGVALIGWIWSQSLVPAVHPDHDHGLENIAGGGALRVESVEGGTRNLVGRPDRVLILHWFALGVDATAMELPRLIDYARSIEHDDGIEVVLVAVQTPRERVHAWAVDHGVPTENLYVDPAGKTAQLIGVRRMPETLIYAPDGQLVHQARGPMAWSDPQLQQGIAQYRQGGGETQTD